MMSLINYYNFPNDNTTFSKYQADLIEANKKNMTDFYLTATQQLEDFILQYCFCVFVIFILHTCNQILRFLVAVGQMGQTVLRVLIWKQ